ncbi:LytTR family DNA-binding domain-containing protein [Pelagibacterium halotolerans]|uniref:LytTR family DNA-binding domain-containing protein n=1 Tax=Pelagibacterium halotolerans TaxID=531813 RepID=UPI00384E9BB7
MNWPPLHLALRETQAVYRDRRALSAIALVGTILGLAGPFGTFAELSAPLRVLYWLVIAFSTYGLGQFGGTLLARWIVPERRPLWASVLVMALGAAVPVTLMVLVINRVFFTDIIFSGWGSLVLLFYCFSISLVLIAMIEYVVGPLVVKAPEAPPREGPRLLSRLPHHLRGPLSHMSMADHYVEVHTAKGSALVLMRLADAIAETEGVAGLQIHRSHWVALDAVSGLERRDGKTFVALKSGVLLPVSRRYLDAARAAFG